MAADKYIHERLISWANWSLQRECGGMGFPSECPYTRMQARSGGGFVSPDVDLEAMDIEMAVAQLPEYLRDTVRVFYIAPGTIDQKARDLHCCRRSIYTRIEHAKEKIEVLLNARRKKNI